MSGRDLLTTQLRKRFPEAAIEVGVTPAGYELRLQGRAFAGLSRADREGLVYAALDAVPIALLAKVAAIKTADGINTFLDTKR
jgi:hypothetical protein